MPGWTCLQGMGAGTDSSTLNNCGRASRQCKQEECRLAQTRHLPTRPAPAPSTSPDLCRLNPRSAQ